MATTGGCQCGAVRYAFDGPTHEPHLCHCRMCQKAVGNYFMPLAGVDRSDFRLTRGELSHFASSSLVERGFCCDCGTPLTFETIGEDRLAITLGSLDDPSAVVPETQDGVESRISWFAKLAALSEQSNENAGEVEARTLQTIAATNNQHPDYET